MITTGILLTCPHGVKFWHPCPDPDAGYRQMAAVAFTYGQYWDHPETRVEFGSDDGTAFTPTKNLRPKDA